jgi:hypothetical protein
MGGCQLTMHLRLAAQVTAHRSSAGKLKPKVAACDNHTQAISAVVHASKSNCAAIFAKDSY